MNCQYCNKEYNLKLALKCHEIRCKQNPNRKYWKSNKNGKGHPAWNKGLTKETDERIKKASDKYHENFINGKFIIKGHPHTKETKELLSKKRTEYLAS